ncbi:MULTISPECIES: PepSY domain-containing protein [Actinosynnema]|uniref:PepSY-associated TM helix domain-containing protein n=1 Tax=Actinosynnema TaxID=40566 RepID=UPI0020A4E841|nr:PepSY-associated TM helix domain-containing protein [Actinosynnema pretiosum]MCP2092407.1 putative iron-regulated membrane protein [Actinosynnema pretiosum]
MSIAERGTPRASPDESEEPGTPATPGGPDEPGTTGTTGEPAWPALRALLLRLHFYAGVLIGPFLVVAAVTGIAYVFTSQLERAVYDHELRVPAADTTLPLDEQADIARALVPDGRLTGVRPGPTPTDSTQVVFKLPGQRESYNHTVFVDPHTGEVRGQHETYGSGQALPLRGWIDNLHRNLHLGEFGRLYSELAASWLWVVVLAGLALWIGRRRKHKRELVLPRPAPAGRRRVLSWHGAVGLWAAAGLLFLSATGLTWSAYAGATVGEVRTALDWTTPAVTSAVDAAADGPDIGLQAARDAALAVGLTDPVEVRPPAEGKAYVVQQVQRSWPEKQDSAAIHPVTGEVLDVLRFADYPLAAKLTRWGIDAHMGLLFGLPNQLVLTALALALVALVLWGYRMWWQRRPTRGGARFGRAPARGGWRRTPGRVLAPVAVLAAVVGYHLPLLGIPLLAFLALDVVLGARQEREARQEGTQAEAGPGASADDGLPDEGTANTEERGVPA